MRIWLILMREGGTTWLHEAWDDDTTADNPKWKEAVDNAREYARENGCEIRICSALVDGVFEVFDLPELRGRVEA